MISESLVIASEVTADVSSDQSRHPIYHEHGNEPCL